MIDIQRIIFDKRIRDKYNCNYISGTDEAGRGAMAGPIVVASVILPKQYQNPLIKDSKKLSSKERERLFLEITKHALNYSVAIIEAKEIDLLNPKKASQVGMIKTLKKLKIHPSVSLIDAEKINLENFLCLSFIKGDDLSQSIAAASIIAKVTRDNLMIEYGQKYPEYGFEQHKGYCTSTHQSNLEKNGVSPIHRVSYKPVKIILSQSK